jgi:hypothetical protein
MGTNFMYMGLHVGKRVSLGRGNGMKFIWAMHPSTFYSMMPKDVAGTDEDDCKEWVEVVEAIAECSEFEYSNIGEEFS